MRRHSAVVLPAVVLLLLAACGGAAAPSATADAPIDVPTATEAPSSTETAEATASPSEDAELAECESGEMPNLDEGWAFLEGADGTFGVSYPDDWEDLSGDGAFTVSTLLDAETFDELGLESDATIESDFVRSPEGVPNFSVFHFGAVESSTEEIHEREVARYGELDELEQILETSLTECLGGTPASGLSLEFRSSDGEVYYQQNLFAVRDGELYVVQWLDFDDSNTDLLGEILTTWGWMFGSGESEPDGTGGIAEAHMATEVDESLDEPDPDTFVTSFTTDASTIYVVFRADEGAEGTVNLTWLIDGAVAFEATLDMTADTTWAWGGITPPSGGFEPGAYEVQLELNGDVESVSFAVESP